MQIKFTSVMVDDQEKALRFYVEVLGFEKMADLPFGSDRWLTVTSPDGIDGVELVLEPMGFPPARAWQKALFAAGIPATAFVTRDIRAEFDRLAARGVTFRGQPTAMGPITAVLFEDGCGNLINLVQPKAEPKRTRRRRPVRGRAAAPSPRRGAKGRPGSRRRP